MIAYLKGTLISTCEAEAIIDVQGIGYRVFIPLNLSLPEIGSPITLHTSLVVRETCQSLFGFSTSLQRELFEKFVTVSGVGPKLALNLIGHLSLKELRSAIEHKDLTTLCKIPGIGKKTAERLSLELRDTLKSLFINEEPLDPLPVDLNSQKIQDAMNALIRLGYHQQSAKKAIQKSLPDLPEDVNLANLITHALKHI